MATIGSARHRYWQTKAFGSVAARLLCYVPSSNVMALKAK